MWMPTEEDAVEMYANYLSARHGRSAHQYARKIAHKLHKKGDIEGHMAWTRVADIVERRVGKSLNIETVTPMS